MADPIRAGDQVALVRWEIDSSTPPKIAEYLTELTYGEDRGLTIGTVLGSECHGLYRVKFDRVTMLIKPSWLQKIYPAPTAVVLFEAEMTYVTNLCLFPKWFVSDTPPDPDGPPDPASCLPQPCPEPISSRATTRHAEPFPAAAMRTGREGR